MSCPARSLCLSLTSDTPVNYCLDLLFCWLPLLDCVLDFKNVSVNPCLVKSTCTYVLSPAYSMSTADVRSERAWRGRAFKERGIQVVKSNTDHKICLVLWLFADIDFSKNCCWTSQHHLFTVKDDPGVLWVLFNSAASWGPVRLLFLKLDTLMFLSSCKVVLWGLSLCFLSWLGPIYAALQKKYGLFSSLAISQME